MINMCNVFLNFHIDNVVYVDIYMHVIIMLLDLFILHYRVAS